VCYLPQALGEPTSFPTRVKDVVAMFGFGGKMYQCGRQVRGRGDDTTISD
jgi:ABC-type Mn2+/Zn2+ transport system ATPase subunit